MERTWGKGSRSRILGDYRARHQRSRRHRTRFICRVYCRRVRPTAFYGCFSKEAFCHPRVIYRSLTLPSSAHSLSFSLSTLLRRALILLSKRSLRPSPLLPFTPCILLPSTPTLILWPPLFRCIHSLLPNGLSDLKRTNQILRRSIVFLFFRGDEIFLFSDLRLALAFITTYSIVYYVPCSLNSSKIQSIFS